MRAWAARDFSVAGVRLVRHRVVAGLLLGRLRPRLLRQSEVLGGKLLPLLRIEIGHLHPPWLGREWVGRPVQTAAHANRRRRRGSSERRRGGEPKGRRARTGSAAAVRRCRSWVGILHRGRRIGEDRRHGRHLGEPPWRPRARGHERSSGRGCGGPGRRPRSTCTRAIAVRAGGRAGRLASLPARPARSLSAAPVGAGSGSDQLARRGDDGPELVVLTWTFGQLHDPTHRLPDRPPEVGRHQVGLRRLPRVPLLPQPAGLPSARPTSSSPRTPTTTASWSSRGPEHRDRGRSPWRTQPSDQAQDRGPVLAHDHAGAGGDLRVHELEGVRPTPSSVKMRLPPPSRTGSIMSISSSTRPAARRAAGPAWRCQT